MSESANQTLDEQLADYTDRILEQGIRDVSVGPGNGSEMAKMQRTVRFLKSTLSDRQPPVALRSQVWARVRDEWHKAGLANRRGFPHKLAPQRQLSLWRAWFGRRQSLALGIATVAVLAAVALMALFPNLGDNLTAAAGSPNNVVLILLVIGCLVFIGLVLWMRRKP